VLVSAARAGEGEESVFFAITLAGGLGLLLLGMHSLRQGLKSFAGSHLQSFLLWMTATPWRGFFSGIVVTALLQSSTALTVLVVSFVAANLISYRQALGLVLGSNIGSTVTTQLLAFPLEEYALSFMVIGTLGYLCLNTRYRYLALSLFGLGCLFFSLQVLETGMAPFAESERLTRALHQLGDHHFGGVIAGTVLAALLHSSSATTGIVMMLTGEGYLTLPAALAFVFGANIGTCVTAVIASLAASRAAQRVALFHVLLNVFGVLLFYPFLHPLAKGIEWLGGSAGRQIANAHTLFNLISSLVAMPFLPWAERLLLKLR